MMTENSWDWIKFVVSFKYESSTLSNNTTLYLPNKHTFVSQTLNNYTVIKDCI